MTNATPPRDPGASSTPIDPAAKEIATLRQRQVTAFRVFILAIALVTVAAGQYKVPPSTMRSMRQFLIGACIVAGVGGYWVIRSYQQRIDLIGRVSGASGVQPPGAPSSGSAATPGSNAYAVGVLGVGFLAALLNWVLMVW